ncbi:hypothetical protein BDZ91DRAFT_828044 [Kalaharituber pfeilii]|nr:hypothetical protein BDZ91DRAFT_828044 [Kalaharituber pfeilii]
MNCAVVSIQNGERSLPTVDALRGHPDMFVGNIHGLCLVPRTDYELKFPDPGRDVGHAQDREYERILPENCGPMQEHVDNYHEAPSSPVPSLLLSLLREAHPGQQITSRGQVALP